MSIFKKETSPGRPPVPKLALLRNRQTSGADSVAIRFNAASFDNEDSLEVEDVTLVTQYSSQNNVRYNDRPGNNSDKHLNKNGEDKNKQQHHNVHNKEEKDGKQDKRQKTIGFNSSSSKSAPPSQVTTPDSERIYNSNYGMASSASSQPISKVRENFKPSAVIHEEEKSLFSGIKERIHDKIQNKLTDVIGKIEEISGESGIGEALERRLRKGDNLDSNKGFLHKSDHLHKKDFSFDSSRSRHSSASGSEVFEDYDTLDDSNNAPRSNSVVMLEDFCSDPFVDASDGTVNSKPRPNSVSGIPELYQVDQSKSSKFSFSKKWQMKNREKKGSIIETSHSVPVSMSALLSQKEKTIDLEDELIGGKAQSDAKNMPDEERCKNVKMDVKESLIEPARTEDLNQLDTNETNVRTSTSQTKAGKDILEKKDSVEKKSSQISIKFSRQNIISAIIALIAYMIIPLPSYISGMVSGAVLASTVLLIYQWLTKPAKPVKVFVPPDITDKIPLRVPEMRQSKNMDGKFCGWMNELPFYDPSNYHIGNTKSVYVQLEGTNLRLQTPKQGIPKRAIWNEPSVYPASFMKQRFFDLTDSKIFLLPEGLVSKRLWSKKYPICIRLAKKGQKTKVMDAKEHSVVQTAATEEAKSLGYDMLAPGELCDADCLYLFARTCREKEEWYHRFIASTKSSPLPTKLSDLVEKANVWKTMRPSKSGQSMASLENSFKEHKREDSFDSNISDASSARETELYSGDYFEKTLMEYIQYMTQLVPAEDKNDKKKHLSNPNLQGTTADSSVMWGTVPIVCEPSLMWLNAALGRLFFDFLREQYWADKVRDKIQRKLSKIHVPYFIDELTVTGIDLGSQVPVIQRTSRPYLDDRGLWLDIDIAYGGGFTMSLETKVNLMKLKRNSEETCPAAEELTRVETLCPKGWAVTDSAEEDSAESSTDEEAEEEYVDDKTIQTEPAGKKFLKIVDRIAQSKYFQQATENKYIKKAMEGVSNTRLMLTVEMKSCVGTMALNIPPPPTDRLWYGFRTNPHLVLSAKPRVGHREVSIVHVTEWIEKKLAVEFQRVLVMPNMDDLVIPLLCDNIEEDDKTPPPEEAQEAGEIPQRTHDSSIAEGHVDIAEEPELD